MSEKLRSAIVGYNIYGGYMKLWIRVRYQMNKDDWMEVPMSDKLEWENTVSHWCIKESESNPIS